MLGQIKIYNTLKRRKQFFKPQRAPVKMYACGVTVYDECHIGHARSLYIFDLIKRYLKYKNYSVIFVRNITDIDDKIINRANELNIDYKELTKKYIDSYYKDLEILNIESADYEPKATENIEDMILYIEDLIKKKFAYRTETGIYFSVRRFKGYGKLSHQSLRNMLVGTRKEPDETKEYPLDFALWKFSKADEPYFESPWGIGRPGWHTECVVMSQKFLKTDTIDIHGGGIDLIFPHHENEIAQAEAVNEKPFVKYWIHSGLLTINGQKMAKSLGNFISIKDFLNKYSNINILKYFFLTAHYSQPLDYSSRKIEEARKRFESINIFLNRIKNLEKSNSNIKELEELKKNFFKALDDDFNTPKALAMIDTLVRLGNKKINDIEFLKNAKFLLENFCKILGIYFIEEEIDKEIKHLISEREKARREGNYKLADEIRKNLYLKGIILEDTKEGTIWRRKI